MHTTIGQVPDPSPNNIPQLKQTNKIWRRLRQKQANIKYQTDKWRTHYDLNPGGNEARRDIRLHEYGRCP